jgi:Phage tail tube protein, GTA-gp10
MANRERGEVSLTVNGTTYTLRPTVNAICDLEDLLQLPFAAIAEKASAGDIRAMRALMWAYLQDKHADEIKSPRDAGAWIERAGGLRQVETALREVTALNAPTETARPPEAQAVLAGAIST